METICFGRPNPCIGQGKYAAAQPLFEKALGDQPPAPDRRSPRHRDELQQPGGQPPRPGEVRGGPAALREGAWRSTAGSSPTTTPTPPSSYHNLAINLKAQGKYAAAQPLFEKALEINRRLLTDDHPDTATSYNNLAGNLIAQGKYAAAQPLFEKALEIRRRLLTDDHPDTALSYNNLAHNLNAQGKYAAAQPLFEKALEISRRLLTDEHPDYRD